VPLCLRGSSLSFIILISLLSVSLSVIVPPWFSFLPTLFEFPCSIFSILLHLVN
jgi:hypothetical protein